MVVYDQIISLEYLVLDNWKEHLKEQMYRDLKL